MACTLVQGGDGLQGLHNLRHKLILGLSEGDVPTYH